MTRRVLAISLAPSVLASSALGACARNHSTGDEHAAHAVESGGTVVPLSPGDRSLPASAAAVDARLKGSPRHGEWVVVRTSPTDSVRAYIVYPERSGKAPVVVVIHEIFGLSNWVRGVADQLAADGYVAIAPDLLTMKLGWWQPTDPPRDQATSRIRELEPEDVQRDLDAVAKYAMALPAAQQKYGVVGYCWGGSTSFAHAAHANPRLGAAVVYYGTAPPAAQLANVKAPVLGLYGGNDARVDATIPAADSAMKSLGKSYRPIVYAGAGHGFLRAQDDTTGGNQMAPANVEATKKAWPETLAFFRQNLGR